MICKICFDRLKEYAINIDGIENTIFVCFDCKTLSRIVWIKGKWVYYPLEKL